MPQLLIPMFPAHATPISDILSFVNKEGMIYYFHGCLPIFCHEENDLRAFRYFTCQLVESGSCKQVDIVRAFGISAISMKRWVKKYREGGIDAFFEKRRDRQPRVLIPRVLGKAQDMLDKGISRSEVAKVLGLKPDTLYRAIRTGRLEEGKKKPKAPAQRVSEV